MSDKAKDPMDNEAVLNIAKIMKNVMSSAAESEIGALFLNSRKAIPARTTLIKMGHPQPPTPIQIDNTTGLGVFGKSLTPKAMKSTDMQHWWMRDRSDQNQFRYYCGPGKYNWTDYWTKHLCAAHHHKKRSAILTPRTILDKLGAARKQPLHKWFRATSMVC